MYVSVNIWFLWFVIAAVCCCIHVCSVTGEISQRKRHRRVKTTEIKQLFSKNYLNSPGGFKVHPGLALLYLHRAAELKRHALRFTYNVLVLKDHTHGIRAQPEDNFQLTSRLIMNIVIRSECEARESLVCDGS